MKDAKRQEALEFLAAASSCGLSSGPCHDGQAEYCEFLAFQASDEEAGRSVVDNKPDKARIWNRILALVKG